MNADQLHEPLTSRTLFTHTLIRGHWPSILAGAVAGFATAVLMGTLGGALGLTAGLATDTSNTTTAFGAGAIVWLLITGLVVGIVSGAVMSALSLHDETYRPSLFGFVNWACGLILVVLVAALGSTGPIAALGGAATSAATHLGIRSAFDRNDVRAAPDADRNAPAGTARPLSTEDKLRAEEVARTAAKTATALAWSLFLMQIVTLGSTLFFAHRHVKVGSTRETTTSMAGPRPAH